MGRVWDKGVFETIGDVRTCFYDDENEAEGENSVIWEIRDIYRKKILG